MVYFILKLGFMGLRNFVVFLKKMLTKVNYYDRI